MYHAMYPSQMMVQIMGGQQANGQCPPVPTHAMHINATNVYQQIEYVQYHPDTCTQNRHQMLQTVAPPDRRRQPEIPSRRCLEYVRLNGSSTSPNWQICANVTNSVPVVPSTHLTFRPSTNGSIKKTNWSNKTAKRMSYKSSATNNEKCNSDSGFSSRSPTPNKHQADNSQTESSDERDSVISLIDQGIKKSHSIHSCDSTNNRVMQYSLISSASSHQYYQNQRPMNFYHSDISTARSQVQNYQTKRRYYPGRNSSPPQRLQRSKRYTGSNIPPNYSVFSRCGIAPDRFLARSHLIQVTRTPHELLTGSIWDNLSTEIWSKFMSNQQTEIVYRKKMMLWRYLYIYIKSVFPKYGLFMVGSTMNGFGSDNSDVDICLLAGHTGMDQRTEALRYLEQILRCLKKCDFIHQLQLIQAKVPILKFHDSRQNLEVDLNCNNAVGIRNTHLLYCYSRIDWRVRPLVLVVKLWAQSQDINNAKNMTISSYSLALMVIHFLQCGVSPPVLPCLHALYVDKFVPNADIHGIDIHEELDIPAKALGPINRQSLGELFVAFFRYYITFDFNHYAISVRLASKIPIEECRRARSYKNEPHQWKYLCVEEPFDLTNTARSVYDPIVFARIKHAFGRTYNILKSTHDLARIFVKG